MTRVHRIAGLRISRVAPSISANMAAVELGAAQGRELLPDLEPAQERLRREKSRIFSSDSIALSRGSAIEDVFEPKKRAENNNPTAKMTVYVLNAIVIVFAMPVGLALLFLNIFGGANLRTTAHVMALTGLFMALAATDEGARMFWIM